MKQYLFWIPRFQNYRYWSYNTMEWNISYFTITECQILSCWTYHTIISSTSIIFHSLITAPMIAIDNMYLSVKIAYNPWHCSAEYQWILGLLCTDGLMLVGRCFNVPSVMYWAHKNFTSRLCDMDHMLCATPSNMNGSSIRNAGKVPSMYRKISNIRRTKSQNLNVSHLVL